MSLSERSLKLLLARAQREHKQSGAIAARSRTALGKAQQTATLLTDFITQRQSQQRALQGQTVSISALRVASGFAGKLQRAVVSQKATVASLDQVHQEKTHALNQAGQRVETMRHLQANLKRRQRQRQLMAEQRLTDEAAARMKRQEYSHGTNESNQSDD